MSGSAPRVAALVGNPRADSRTHLIARTVAAELHALLGGPPPQEIDLAALGAAVLDPGDAASAAAVERTLAADVLVVASPTYKATYSGLLKAFLDRIPTGALRGTRAVGLLLGGAPDHRLAVDVHLTPLLLELGAGVPTRGLFVLERELDDFAAAAAAWAANAAPSLRP